MAGVILIALLVIGFYAFIGFAPEEAKQIVLVLAWAIMLLATPVSLAWHYLR